jgi:hypothetical protein
VNPRHGIPVFQSIKTNPARADISAEVNKEGDALAVGRSSTGGINVPLIQNPSSRNQNQTDMIKDEYFNINDFNNLSLDFGEISNLTHEYYEYEQGQADIIVKSRLKKHYNFWKNIGCYDYILDTIYNGYRIPFFSTPPSICLSNNRSAVNHSEFVVEAIHDLLIKGLIEECESKPIVVNPLIVSVSSSNKKRLILDLKHVNLHLWKTSVKFKDIRIAMQFITNNSYCFKFDLHSAYHHVDIFKSHTDYLGFSWCYGNTVNYLKFLVLPFGLSSACYIFTKLTRPLVKNWRGEGKQIMMHVDDGIDVHIDLQVCKTLSDEVRQDLILSGFVLKKEKYMWSPVQQLTILGYFIDTEKHLIYIPEERLLKVFKTINLIEYNLEKFSKVSVRLAASLVGQICLCRTL